MMKTVLGILVLILSLTACGEGSSSTVAHIGDEATLNARSDDFVLVSSSEEARSEYLKAAAVNDMIGVKQLMAADRLVTVPATTRVLVLPDGNMDSREVRILDGDWTGNKVWVSRKDVRAAAD